MQPSAIQSLPCLLTVGVTEPPVGDTSSGGFLLYIPRYAPTATQPCPQSNGKRSSPLSALPHLREKHPTARWKC